MKLDKKLSERSKAKAKVHNKFLWIGKGAASKNSSAAAVEKELTKRKLKQLGK